MKFSMTALVFSAIGMVSALPSASKSNDVSVNTNSNIASIFSTAQSVDTSEYTKVYNNVASSAMAVDYANYFQKALRTVHQMTTEENIQKVSSVSGAMAVANKYVKGTDLNAHVQTAIKQAATIAKGTNFNLLATQGINYAQANAASINFNLAASLCLKLLGSLSSVTSFDGLKSKITQLAMNYFL